MIQCGTMRLPFCSVFEIPSETVDFTDFTYSLSSLEAEAG
jgi:hypothetical protein